MKILSAYRDSGIFWFRLFGHGFYLKYIEVVPLTFSERNGFKRTLRIGDWRIGML